MSLLSLPEVGARRVVTSDVVDRFLADTRRELEELEEQVRITEAQAIDAERRAVSARPAPHTATAVALMQGLVNDMVTERRVAMRRELEEAKAQAAERMAFAQADVDDLLGDAHASTVATVVERALSEPPAEVAPVIPVPLREPAPVVAPVPVVVGPPSAPEVVALGPDVVDERAPEQVHEDFWREEAEATEARSRGLSIVPIEAVLPMIALVIVLVVVLAWIG